MNYHFIITILTEERQCKRNIIALPLIIENVKHYYTVRADQYSYFVINKGKRNAKCIPGIL